MAAKAVSLAVVANPLCEHLAFSGDGSLLAVGAGKSLLLVSVDALLNNDGDPIKHTVEFAEFKSIDAQDGGFLVLGKNGALVFVKPDATVTQILEKVKCVTPTEESRFYACTAEDVVTLDNQAITNRAAWPHEMIPYAFQPLFENWYALLGFDKDDETINIMIFESSLEEAIDFGNNVYGAGDFEPYPDAIEGLDSMDVMGWFKWIPERKLLLFTHSYHHFVETVYFLEDG
jgi:hypothetical protein